MDSSTEKIHRILDEYYDPDQKAVWISRPQLLLNGLTPAYLMSTGRADEVLALLERMDAGAYL